MNRARRAEPSRRVEFFDELGRVEGKAPLLLVDGLVGVRSEAGALSGGSSGASGTGGEPPARITPFPWALEGGLTVVGVKNGSDESGTVVIVEVEPGWQVALGAAITGLADTGVPKTGRIADRR